MLLQIECTFHRNTSNYSTWRHLAGFWSSFTKPLFLFHQQSMLECGFNGFIKSLSVFEHVKPMNLKLASIRFD